MKPSRIAFSLTMLASGSVFFFPAEVQKMFVTGVSAFFFGVHLICRAIEDKREATMAWSENAIEEKAHRIVSEFGPRWWNDHTRRFPNSKLGEAALRDDMARYCVRAALTAASSIDGGYNAGVEATIALAKDHAKGYSAYKDHGSQAATLLTFAKALEKLKR